MDAKVLLGLRFASSGASATHPVGAGAGGKQSCAAKVRCGASGARCHSRPTPGNVKLASAKPPKATDFAGLPP
eukprot:1118902-Pleurochrysis_carterae.AAC.2